MPVALAVWSIKLVPGEVESIIPPADLKITNIALGDEIADEKARTSVRLVYQRPSARDGEDDEEEEDEDEDEDTEMEPVQTFLGSLTPGKIEQAIVDVILEKDEEILFEAVGKNVIFVTGNFIDQGGDDESEYDYDPDEDDYDLQDIPSDVEIDASELEVPSDDDADRFEEVEDEESTKDSKKRPRESDTMDTDEPKLSKSEKKKQNKKLKAESGKAVATGEEKPPAKEDKKEKKEKKKAEKAEKPAAKVIEKEGGLKIKDHKVGSGPQAKKGDKVSVRYIGKLTNGKEFDKNVSGKPFHFRLGKGEVIKGWDEGILGMHVGGERLITVPPAMGYGKGGSPPVIPSNATLIFEVKLIKIN
ncbi:hypothetical protein QCA50_004592 [Cerrena zonata]|uniref:FK506-binding protein n=1 Tax=Cerrena zonata TaxID=2478898 RepID=A0AAW0GK07_9APHY